jgi:Lsr2
MSKSASVIITDDLDGSQNAETVLFGLDGVTYEVDLGKKNRARLEKALGPVHRGWPAGAAGRPPPWRQSPGWLTGRSR